MMQHRGYKAHIEFDQDAELFHGEILGILDVITFQGSSVEELKQAFQDSVDDYLEFCAAEGKEPDKPYSGKFNLRIPPELHRQLDEEARTHHASLNQWLIQKLSGSIETHA